MAASTRPRNPSFTEETPLSTLETVPTDTLACLATSLMVAMSYLHSAFKQFSVRGTCSAAQIVALALATLTKVSREQFSRDDP
jgi:hypothetical protein